jgi:hypothetical protein
VRIDRDVFNERSIDVIANSKSGLEGGTPRGRQNGAGGLTLQPKDLAHKSTRILHGSHNFDHEW